MDNEKTPQNQPAEGVELTSEQTSAISGGGWLNVDVSLQTTEGKGRNPLVMATPQVGFGRLDENS